MRKVYLVPIICISVFLGTNSIDVAAQGFTRADSLRGTITPERAWWDLTYYHLDITVNPDDSSIVGSNTVQFRVEDFPKRMQIDLQAPMKIQGIRGGGKDLKWTKDGNAHFVEVDPNLEIGGIHEIKIEYSGKPRVSTNPPWTGGFTWSSDPSGKPFIATSCQGDGSSLWWPCKDHPKDEVDSMLISVTYPADLMNVSNGRLRSLVQNGDGTNTTHWFVNNPINDYGVNVNIADYVHFSEKYKGEGGELDCDYWVLKINEAKAKKQFKQVSKMLEAFEYWFGPYPWYEDGFKLVEAPYLGMEHQSSVTYGNGYQNGYRGNDLSGTGEGLKFDFIIVHEAGHEWFANSITYQDVADMWIHESFTAYSENLYLGYHFGIQSGANYVIGTRKAIQNDIPIIGQYNVANRGSGDMYYKGANMLHTIRHIIDDDDKWRGILRGLNKEFYHQTVSTSQIENYMIKESGIDLSKIFDQYLRDIRIPELEFKIRGKKLSYRWSNCVDGFNMPVVIELGEERKSIQPSEEWKTCKIRKKVKEISLDRNYYATSKAVKP